jgi:hypothetical protein
VEEDHLVAVEDGADGAAIASAANGKGSG